MSFEEKHSRALKELEASKIWKSNYQPPLFKTLHKLGIKIPLPHYNSFLTNSLLMGGFFCIAWGITMYFLQWKNWHLTIPMMLGSALISGSAFGILMATYYKISAAKNALSQWSDL